MATIDAHEFLARKDHKELNDHFGIILSLSRGAELTLFGVEIHWHSDDQDDAWCFERRAFAITFMNVSLLIGIFRD